MKKLTHRRVYIQPSNKCIVINTDGLICVSEGDVTGDSGQKGNNEEEILNPKARFQDFFIESDED